MSLEVATENEIPMKAKKQASEGTPFNDLRACTWNIRTLNSASAKLAKTLIKYGADISAIHETVGQHFLLLTCAAEAVVGFERPPKRNQWHDDECRAASAVKNDAYKR